MEFPRKLELAGPSGRNMFFTAPAPELPRLARGCIGIVLPIDAPAGAHEFRRWHGMDDLARDGDTERPLLVCLSHLRWDFIWQRPQELMSRAARSFDVLFVEEPLLGGADPVAFDMRATSCGVRVAHLRGPRSLTSSHAALLTQAHLHRQVQLRRPVILWYCAPNTMEWTTDLPHDYAVLDCMEGVPSIQGAARDPASSLETLMSRVHLVITGAQAPLEVRRRPYAYVHLFSAASSWDATWLDIRQLIERGLSSPLGVQAGLLTSRLRA